MRTPWTSGSREPRMHSTTLRATLSRAKYSLTSFTLLKNVNIFLKLYFQVKSTSGCRGLKMCFRNVYTRHAALMPMEVRSQGKPSLSNDPKGQGAALYSWERGPDHRDPLWISQPSTGTQGRKQQLTHRLWVFTEAPSCTRSPKTRVKKKKKVFYFNVLLLKGSLLLTSLKPTNTYQKIFFHRRTKENCCLLFLYKTMFSLNCVPVNSINSWTICNYHPATYCYALKRNQHTKRD